MTGEKKALSQEDMVAAARKAAAEVIDKFRSEGLTDEEIEKKLGRRLPPE